MSLEGAKFICLDEAGNHGKIVLAKDRKFTMGYYVNCDFVLVDERAKGVHCEIECDAFGRVTIRNLSPDKPILVNGSAVEIKRILLNNSRLSILDREFLWLFPKTSNSEFEDLPTEAASTPGKQIVIPEQPPNSCPDFKLHREQPKRFTVHNFAYCIQSDDEGNISSETNDKNSNSDTEPKQTQSENENEHRNQTKEVVSTDSSQETVENVDEENKNRKRSVTPELDNTKTETGNEILETPKMNLIDSTKDKQNLSSQKKSKQLTMCHQSDVVITSFSPRETGVKIEKSFAAIVKPKVLIIRTPATPKSVYSTPKCDMNDNDQDNESGKDLIAFYTPSTSKKVPPSAAKVLKNSSMHLIDLTTPTKLAPSSSISKLDLKAASAKKNITKPIEKSCMKLSAEEQLGLTALPATPVITDASTCQSDANSSSSVISVSSSVGVSSVIEVTNDSSTKMGTTGLNTPLKTQIRPGISTPKRTPQSLIKRALLSSAKKHNAASQIKSQNPINPVPVRSNLALLKTPSTPQASKGKSANLQLPRRQSMSTPTRKSGIAASRRFDNYPSSSNLVAASPATNSKVTFSRRSSLNPIFPAGALPTTSTPLSGSCNNFAFRTGNICKSSSSLHKVRKSMGGVPLSSHISKARKLIVQQASTSRSIPFKEKSPQQVMSDRLLTRARQSLCSGTPTLNRSRNMAAAAKTPAQYQPTKRPVIKAVSSKGGEVDDDLSRTFVIDSDEEENIESKEMKPIPKDATFSPEKVAKEQTIEIPVDVEEIIDLAKESKVRESGHQNHNRNEENNSKNVSDLRNNEIKSIVTEESFADCIEIADSPKGSSQTDSQESFAAAVVEENSKDMAEQVKSLNQDINGKTDIVDIAGFGEESTLEYSQTSLSKNNQHSKEDKNEKEDLKEKEINNKAKQQESNTSNNQQKVEEPINNQIIEETKSLKEQDFDEQKLSEYKPIVEDITVEGSTIEKETKENDEINITKSTQLLNENITLERSLIKAKFKHENKEDNEKVIKETTSTNNNELIEPAENIQQQNMVEGEVTNVQQTKLMMSINIQEKEDTKNVENPSNETLYVDNTEIAESTQLHDLQFETSSTQNACKEAFDSKVEGADKISEITELPSEATMIQNENDDAADDFENTNKLLEEIEDVLNKSDEFEKKQLNEMEKNIQDGSENPLTEEESESEKLSQEKDECVEETLSINSENNKLEEKEESEEKTRTTLGFELPAQTESFIIKQEDKNEEQESDKTVELSTIETLKNCESSDNIYVSQFEDNISNEENTTSCKQEKSGTETPINVVAEVQENIVSQAESNNEVTGDQTETKESKNINEKNDENLKAIVTQEVTKPKEQENNALNKNISTEVLNETVKNTDCQTENETTSNQKEKENILLGIENYKQLNIDKKKIENTNATNFTPRRSTRRASQSGDAITPQASFTPRRSARRASLSVESTSVFTPTKITTRRTSLSIVNETTPLTPKRIIKRRTSIDNENAKPTTPRGVKTPRKLLEQSMIIREEMHEIVEEEIEAETETFGENENNNTASVEESVFEKQAITEKMSETNLEEKQSDVETILESQDRRENLISPTKEQQEIHQEDFMILTLNDNIVSDAEETLAKEKIKSEQKQDQDQEISAEKKQNADKEIIEVIAESTDSSGDSNVVGDNVEEPINQDIINDNLEKMEIKIQENKSNKSFGQQHDVDNLLPEEIIFKVTKTDEDRDNVAENLTESHKEMVSVSSNIERDKTTPDKEIPETSENAKHQENITTPETKKSIKTIEDSPKTPAMIGMRELLKTPKDEAKTPRFGGIRDLVRTPKQAAVETEKDEIEKLAVIADLVKTPAATNISEINTNKIKKHVAFAAESPKTPLMTGMRELLQTPKREMTTPKLVGIRELLRTPKTNLENENEEVKEKVVKILKDSEIVVDTNEEEMPSSSMKNYSLKGVKELLKTPQSCSTPRYRGIRELMQTPKISSTPIVSGVKELLQSPATEEDQELQTSTQYKSIKPESTLFLDVTKEPVSYQKHEELEKFLTTPTAKNIMMPSMPSSAVIEKTCDSIEISTEYDLNVTTEDETENLDELFKTPVASRFVESITGSYYDQEDNEHDETDRKFNENKNETLQDTLNKNSEDAFDKLVGQATQLQTPIRKIYKRKSFSLQTPHSQSPFTAADVLSDLPKTDVEEWIESLDHAEPPIILECDDKEEVNATAKGIEEESSLEYTLSKKDKQNSTFDESIIPETCAKIYLKENTLANKSTASLTCTATDDPLSNTNNKLQNPKTALHHLAASTSDAEISGIDLLDQTVESIQDEELSMLDEPLIVEEHSTLEEALVMSDNESETEAEIKSTHHNTTADSHDLSQDEHNDLSEPLLLSDSDDLTVSQDRIESQNNDKIKQTKVEGLEISQLDINIQEKSILENFPNINDSLAEEDPLETGAKQTSVVVIENDNCQDNETISKTDAAQALHEVLTTTNEETELPLDLKEEHTLKEIKHIEDVKQDTSEVLEGFSTSNITDVLETSSTSHMQEKQQKTDNNPQIIPRIEDIDAEIDAAETHIIENSDAKEISIKQTKLISTETEDIFVDTSATEICEETCITSNAEHSDGSQNIFMNSSNIDESFAAEENQTGINDEVATTTANTKRSETDSLLLEETENNGNDFKKENHILLNEVTETEEKNQITEDVETEKKEESDRIEKAIDPTPENVQIPQKSHKTQEIQQTIEGPHELKEMPSQDETQLKVASVLDVASLKENQIQQTKLCETFTTVTTPTLPDTLNEIGKQKIVNEPNTENSTDIEEELKPLSSPVLEKNDDIEEELKSLGVSVSEEVKSEEFEEELKSLGLSVLDEVKSDDIEENLKSLSLSVSDEVKSEEMEEELMPSNPSLLEREMSENIEKEFKPSSLQILEKETSEETKKELKVLISSVLEKEQSEEIEEELKPLCSSVFKKENSEKIEEELKPSNSFVLEQEKSAEIERELQPSRLSVSEKFEEYTSQSSLDTSDVPSCSLQPVIEPALNNRVITIPENELLENENLRTVTKETQEHLNNSEQTEKQMRKLEEFSLEVNDTKSASEDVKVENEDHSETLSTGCSVSTASALYSELNIPQQGDEYKIGILEHKVSSALTEEKNSNTSEENLIPSHKIENEESENTRAIKDDTNDLPGPSEIVKYDFDIKIADADCPKATTETNSAEVELSELHEIKYSKINTTKTGRRKRTASESSQDSEKSTSSHRDRRKIIKKTIDNKLAEIEELNDRQEISKQTIIGEKLKLTASDSSQLSVKGDESYTTTTRTGGRRKLQKAPVEAIVLQQKEECEDLMREKQENTVKEILVESVTKEMPKEKENIREETVTETTQRVVTIEETVIETINEVMKETSKRELVVEQNEKTLEILTEKHKQLETKEKLQIQDEKPESNIAKAKITEIGIGTETENEILTVSQDQVTSKEKKESEGLQAEKEEKKIAKLSIAKLEGVISKEHAIISAAVDTILNVPKESLTKSVVEEDKSEKVPFINSDQTVVTEETTLSVLKEIQKSDDSIESIAKQDKTTKETLQFSSSNQDEGKQQKGEGDDNTAAKMSQFQRNLLKTPVVEEVVAENKKLSATVKSTKINEVILEREPSEPIDTADDQSLKTQSVTLEEVQIQPQKRVCRRAIVVESSLALELDTSHSRRGRRKLQKPEIKEIVIEQLKEKTSDKTEEQKEEIEKEKFIPPKVNENEENSDKTIEVSKVESKVSVPKEEELTSNTIETNQELSEVAVMVEEQVKETSKDHLNDNDSKETTVRRGRTKLNAQENVEEKPTTSRKGRRKVHVPNKTEESNAVESIKADVNEVKITTTASEEHTVTAIAAVDSKEKILKQEQLEVDTKQTAKRGLVHKKEIKEGDIDKKDKRDEIATTQKKLELETRYSDVTVKEIATTSHETSQQNEIKEPIEKINEEMHGNEHSTKQPAKRGRKRKVEVAETLTNKAAISEDRDEAKTTSYTTRRGGRQKTASVEMKTAALPKGRSSNRNRKTPQPQEVTANNEKQIDVVDKTPPGTEAKSSGNRNPKSLKESTKSVQEKQLVEEILAAESTSLNQVESPVVNEEPKESIEKDIEIDTIQETVTSSKKVEEYLASDGEGEKKKKKTLKKGIKSVRTDSESVQGAAENPMDEIKESNEDVELIHATNATSIQIQKNTNIKCLEEEADIEKDIAGKTKETTRRRAAAVPLEKEVKHHEESSIKSRRRRGARHEESVKQENSSSDDTMEPKKPTGNEVLPAVEITKEKLITEDSLQQQAIPSAKKEVRAKRGRKKGTSEENHKTADTEEESNHTQTSEATSSHIGTNETERKEEEKSDNKQIPENNTNIDNKIDSINIHNTSEKKHDIKIQDSADQNSIIENQQPQEQAKKARGRRKKNDHQEEHEQPTTTTLHSPDTKQRGRKAKESNTNPSKDQSDQTSATKVSDSDPKINITTTNTTEYPTTPQRIPSGVRKGRKPVEHITAESTEVEDTPGRRARDVPQRRAATAYHNYDETSDSEILTKAKKKTDSPRKSVDAVKKSPTATITSVSITNPCATPSSSTTLATTARGRTRKPTAKVQQFLEEERAKAETPKKRALLAAAAGINSTTPQRTPAKRGRKPSTVEVEVEGTPQASKGRPRAKAAISHSKEEPKVVPETVTVVEEKKKETELIETPLTASSAAPSKRRVRKGKTTEEEQHTTSDEPPIKKSSLELEKQDPLPTVETPSQPTRVAGRRNAAAAAKARIEEDALAAAAIEPTKRSRAKRTPAKIVTSAATVAVTATSDTTEAHSSAVEEEQKAIKTRDHRLASASTVEGGGEDMEDIIEMETKDKPAATNKRGRKAATATTTDSPAVSAKRVRKGKTATVDGEVADVETLAESLSSRGRGRGRKNVHFDEHHQAEIAATSSQQTAIDIETAPVETSEPVKKVTRTRRK